MLFRCNENSALLDYLIDQQNLRAAAMTGKDSDMD